MTNFTSPHLTSPHLTFFHAESNTSQDPQDGKSNSIISRNTTKNQQMPTIGNTKTQKKPGYRENGRTAPSKKAAPLVDSTLLRFLSKQKSQLVPTEAAVFPRSNTGISIEKVTTLDADTDTAPLDADVDIDAVSKDIAGIYANGDVEDTIIGDNRLKSKSASVPIPVIDTTADILSWFTKYNAHRVAQKLISLGACEESAVEAGNSVQNYSLARTTRQRVRKFLRDRDLEWRTEGNTRSRNGKQAAAGAAGTGVVDAVDGPRYEVSSLQQEAVLRGDRHDIDEVVALLVESGLSGKDIAAIFSHTPSISMMKARRDPNAIANGQNDDSRGETLEDTLNRSFFGVLSSTIKLRKYDARKVLRECPGLLTKRGSISAKEVVSILSNLGVSPSSLCRDKAALPMLLSRSPASLFRFVAFLSSDYVRMPVAKIGPFIRRSECASVLDLIAPLPRYNSNLLDGVDDGIGLADNDIDSTSIQKLLKDGSDNMENETTKRYNAMFKTAEFLRQEVGIEDLGKVLAAFPQVFTIDRDRVIEVVNFLHEELELYHEDIAKIIEAYPMILETEPSQMLKVIDYLRSLEVAEDVLGSIFRAFPALLTQDPEGSMKEVVEFIEEIGVTNIGRFIT